MADVNITMKTDTGCTVHVVGTVDLTFAVPPKFKAFHGTVTISPGGSCTMSGTLIFAMTVRSPLRPTFNDTTPEKLTKVTWSGDGVISKILNGRKINRALCDVLRSVPIATIRPSEPKA